MTCPHRLGTKVNHNKSPFYPGQVCMPETKEVRVIGLPHFITGGIEKGSEQKLYL